MSSSKDTDAYGFVLIDRDGNPVEVPEKLADLWPILWDSKLAYFGHLTRWRVVGNRVYFSEGRQKKPTCRRRPLPSKSP